ncbi:MAG: hypothetical protein R3F11_15390 [Verrucomicrobiales bacterium]
MGCTPSRRRSASATGNYSSTGATRWRGWARNATRQSRRRRSPYQQALPKQGPAGAMLFNLRDDPGETADLSKSHPDKVADLEKRAAQLWREISAASPNTRP